MELRVIRDTDRREVSLVVLKDRQPLFAVECQLDQRLPNRAIAYFSKRTEIPNFLTRSIPYGQSGFHLQQNPRDAIHDSLQGDD